MKKLFLLIGVLLLVSCSKELDIKIDNIQYVEVIHFNKLKKLSFELTDQPKVITYKKDSFELIEFKKWLTNNKKGWSTYYATAAVGDIHVSGDSFSFNIGKGFTILNYKASNGKYKMLYKNVGINDFTFFKKP